MRLVRVTVTLSCPYCGSERLVKYGVTPNGQQRYRGGACGRPPRAHPGSSAYSDAEREAILRAYQERSSLRGLSRTFGVSGNTVTAWLKKSLEFAAAAANLGGGPAGRCPGTG